MGVLGTMFGGIFLLGGGSSKAVQQSPPIKAASRGEEDFIQYVSEIHSVAIATSEAFPKSQGLTHQKAIPQGRRGRQVEGEALSQNAISRAVKMEE